MPQQHLTEPGAVIGSGNNQTVTGFVRDAANNVSAVTANNSKTVNKP